MLLKEAMKNMARYYQTLEGIVGLNINEILWIFKENGFYKKN